MKLISRVLKGLFIVFIIGFLHYSLPQRDVVRVVGTEVKRMDINDANWFWASQDAGTNMETTRDVRFINTVRPSGKVMVYRNEDTNWSWPPYLKFDSSNLTAQSQSLSQENTDQWVAVTHYGWRIQLFSMFPNVVKIKEVSGPNVTLIPWFNIVFILAALFFVWRIWRFIGKWKDNNIDKHVDAFADHAEERIDQVKAHVSSAREGAAQQTSGIRKWLKRWFGI